MEVKFTQTCDCDNLHYGAEYGVEGVGAFIICMFISVVRTQSEAVDVFPRFFFPQNISVITYSYKVCNLNEIETRLHLLFSLSQNLLMLCFSNRYSFTFFSRPK